MVNLTAIRIHKGVTLERLAQTTKISIAYLRAIEAGELEKLPGTIYTRSYLRQYARAIDFNEEELLALFNVAPEPVEPAGPPEGRGALDRWRQWLSPVMRGLNFKRSS
jgi:cytoskeleton protein RodZ